MPSDRKWVLLLLLLVLLLIYDGVGVSWTLFHVRHLARGLYSLEHTQDKRSITHD